MSPQNSPRYRIQAVAQRTGVSAAALRAWERRYGIPTPVRTDTAYRTYSDSDVELIEEMCRLCSSGLSPAEAAKLLKERAHDTTQDARRTQDTSHDTQRARNSAQAQEAYSEHQAHQALANDFPAPAVSDIHEAVVGRIVAAARVMNIGAMEAELTHAGGLGSGLLIFEKVLRPALETIGQLWHDGEISIGHEHLATEMITASARNLLRLTQPTGTERLALLACFADEAHSTSLYGTGLRLAGWGCRVAVLGALTPPAALAPAVKRLQPTLVGLSVTITPPKTRARELLEGYAAACGTVPWLVGGQAAASLEPLIREVGGAVAPSNEQALQNLLNELFGGQSSYSPQNSNSPRR